MIQSAQVGAALHRAARIAAPVIALLITSALLLGHLAYQLGYQLGSAIHAASAALGRLHISLLRLNSMPAVQAIEVSRTWDTQPITKRRGKPRPLGRGGIAPAAKRLTLCPE